MTRMRYRLPGIYKRQGVARSGRIRGAGDKLKLCSHARSLAKLPVETAILDGEIVCLDERGVSQFNQLLSRKVEPVFYAFDLL